MAFYVKLFTGILQSTVWREDLHVKVVWITLLALCDPRGDVAASVPGLAASAGVSLDQCVEALERLSQPDEWSRTQEEGGARVRAIDGGWHVVNYLKYRRLQDEEKRKEQVRESTRRWRERKKLTAVHNDHGDQSEPISTRTRVRTTEQQQQPSTVLESVQAMDSPLAGDPPFLRAHATEQAIRESTDALRTKLYELVSEMVAADPKQRDPTELMRLVTAYERDGKLVGGVVNASLLSHERVEKSISDAEWHLAEWAKSRGPALEEGSDDGA